MFSIELIVTELVAVPALVLGGRTRPGKTVLQSPLPDDCTCWPAFPNMFAAGLRIVLCTAAKHPRYRPISSRMSEPNVSKFGKSDGTLRCFANSSTSPLQRLPLSTTYCCCSPLRSICALNKARQELVEHVDNGSTGLFGELSTESKSNRDRSTCCAWQRS